MKHLTNLPFIVLLAGMVTSMLACNQSAKESTEQQLGERMISREDSLLLPPVDTVLNKIANGDSLIVAPGGSIGALVLETMLSDSIMARLGRADSSDAAMCKSWSMWYWSDSIRHSSNEFDVYAACDPSLDMRKSIQILRLSGAKFITDRGISEKSTRDEVKTMFPTIQSFGTFLTPDGKEIVLLDDPVSGISFEFNASDSLKNIAGIVVYQPGSKLTDAYLPFYSLKK